ncbi:hypothetical protein [Acidiferrobacter sp.]|jgi:hypothetical protein|uniref:hypothetical protein n=1 Tax=Acidiferrobacter sp. TaxID=1872107 RepID=UPI002633C8DB|nr:hypothetical protein [Acidiferrobacter sp.]
MICNDCVIDALHGWVEESPRSGCLRLAQHTNLVWLAVKELGGVLVAAQRLGYPPEEIDRWIDEHHIPYGPGEEVARLSSYTLKQLQVPLMWVEEDGWYWPPSAYLASREQEAKGLRKTFDLVPAHGLAGPDEAAQPSSLGPEEDAKPMSPEQLRIEEALGRSGLFSANKNSQFEVDDDDPKDMGLDDEPWDPQDTSWRAYDGWDD